MTTLLATIFVFGLLIFIHEFGHFLLAKRAGIQVHEFSMGFGPRIAGFKRGETDYNLRIFPLGGFVRFAGLDTDEEEVPPHKSYKNKTVWQRMSVIIAGPLMNFVLAVVLFTIIFLVQGYPSPTTTVGQVLPDRPAFEAGLRAGDEILAVNHREIGPWDWNKLSKVIKDHPGEAVVLTVKRDGAVRDINVTPDVQNGKGFLGIVPAFEPRHVGLIKSLYGGAEYTVRLTGMIINYLGQMIFHQAPADVGGPVRIVSEIGKVAQLGLVPLLHLAAFLSINLGLFNLLPIPALDGSRLFFLGWEGITGRPVAPEKENFIHLVGFGLLIVLMVIVTYNDIAELMM
ncbi:MAG: RIP metalloprotease RseP [Peptococcaceae bacterium]|nr:RIP metalloprotease RseP [Peptococcaceae bacterium]